MPYGEGYEDAGCGVFFGSSGRPEIDYEKPDPQRPFALTVEDKTFYVDPHVLGRVSPVLKTMCQGRFSEGITGSATLNDEKADDIKVLLQSICPTRFGLYPRDVDVYNFPTLCVLADRYLIAGLRDVCEVFATGFSIIEDNSLSGSILLEMFDAAIKGRLSVKTSGYLLYRIMKLSIAGQNEDDELLQSPTGNLLLKAFVNHAAGRLQHRPGREFAPLPYDACSIREQCKYPSRRRCKSTRTVNPEAVYSYCVRCTLQICRKCMAAPCESATALFLEKELKDEE